MRSGRDDAMTRRAGRTLYSVTVSGLTWLSDRTFEIRFHRPDRFDFTPGQKIEVLHRTLHRDYSLIGAVQDSELAICVRLIPNGKLSPVLARAKAGDGFDITAPFGFFFHQPGLHPAVFVATGTGIAPYVAFARAGAEDYHLIHGVRTMAELYYRDILMGPAKRYTPCISAGNASRGLTPDTFHGRVTDYLEQQPAPGAYDFYLCGRGEMVRDATRIIDRRFEGSRVFTELFF